MMVGSVVEDGAEPPPETFAWLICGDEAVGRTFTLTVAAWLLPPGATVPAARVQVSPAHDHVSPGVTDASTRPGGSVSVTVIVPTVVPAPMALVTVRV